MNTIRWRKTTGSVRLLPVAAIAIGLGTIAVQAETIYETADPFGGPFGLIGFDVFEQQSVGVRFTPGGDFTLDGFSIWMWNNDISGAPSIVTFTLRDDQPLGGSTPGDIVFESWEFFVPNTGVFNPEFFTFKSPNHPNLDEGVKYWLVAESAAQAGFDPVWAMAAPGNGFMAFTDAAGNW